MFAEQIVDLIKVPQPVGDIGKTVGTDEVVAAGASIQRAVMRGELTDVLLLDVWNHLYKHAL